MSARFIETLVEFSLRGCRNWRRCLLVVLMASLWVMGLAATNRWSAGPIEAVSYAHAQDKPRFTLETLTGHVVWLDEAMLRLQGVQWADDARRRVLALETADGQLIPLVEDVRGRGFRKDERLRGRLVELLVRRYAGSPTVQVLKLYEWETVGQGATAKKEKYELDYWCSVCAIAMFELKRCECCQGDTELRRRLINSERDAR